MRVETFDCLQACRRQGTAEYDPDERAARNCALPDFPRHRWTGEHLVQIHMGASPRYDREGQDGDWQRPLEDIASNGCPGSYYRYAFVRSLWPFRRKASDGNRIANPLLDRCDDRLVLEWIHVLEDFEDAEHADFLAKVSGGH